ncbi:MAG: isoleucine--tRNA ligase [Proteobacteria bacterium]|nr:isoleucine--tRNA ligase [Pseudomonadota bacterium]
MLNYKETVFLPQTSFPMKGNLPLLEPKILEIWQNENLYEKIQERSSGKPSYILHDGPPYANGHLHMGHALNKILKDIILKFYHLYGYRVPFIPGWDCHGLPIEWKIEEEYRKKGLSKEDITVEEFRAECRAYAQKWVYIQSQEVQRLGVLGDWKHPYITMDFKSEALVVQEIFTFLKKGLLYRGVRPVFWSVVEKTALAEAEVEYHDHVSPSIYVAFSVSKSKNDLFNQNTSVVIWTTTPWTLPGNRAVAYGEEIDYVLFEEENGQRYIIGKDLLQNFQEKTNKHGKVLKTFKGHDLKDVFVKHPLYNLGYPFEVPLLPGDHVTTAQGTGLVHIAPGHGEEDFNVGKKFGLEIPETVGGDGYFYAHVPLFKGEHVFKVNPKVIEALEKERALLYAETLKHSFPHSWRSKAPLIFRTTPQWFISLDKDGLRQRALNLIDHDVRWIPALGKNRIRSMVENRPDWCLSRQRTWGVPIAIFTNIQTGETLNDPRVNERILSAIEAEGGDAWYKGDPRRFLEGLYEKDLYEPVMDCVDVWFDSGSSHSYVLEQREGLYSPADLYVEGSDQHRGWFQSSLLEACGTRNHAPFKTVLTHGFVLDEKGYKMSKSLGNTILPQKIIDEMGADILRLWVVNSDYSEDLRVGVGILKHQQEIYRRFRNTLRYLLGALKGFSDKEKVTFEDMGPLERYILHRLYELEELAQKTRETFDFHRFYTELHTFISSDLSAFYFDIRKDVLYCDSRMSLKRRSVRTVMDILFNRLLLWIAPVLSFTAEEAFKSRKETEESIFLEEMPKISKEWKNKNLGLTWKDLRNLRRVLTGALELERSKGTLGSSLEANLIIYIGNERISLFKEIDLAEFAIVSEASLVEGAIPEDAFTLPDVPGIGVHVLLSDHQKCERCWKMSPDVGTSENHPKICTRCAEAVEIYLKQEDA